MPVKEAAVNTGTHQGGPRIDKIQAKEISIATYNGTIINFVVFVVF